MFIIAATQSSGYQHTRYRFSQRGLLNLRQVNEDIIHIIINIAGGDLGVLLQKSQMEIIKCFIQNRRPVGAFIVD